MGWWRGLLRSVWGSLSKGVREHVGTDHLGNNYYFIAEYKNWRAWIRRTRKTPPTMEEILKNEKYREEIKIKSKEFYEKDKLGKEANEELLPSPAATQIKGHAAAPYFGQEEPSGAPTSTGQTFQPGSWMPEDDKRQNQ
ncbi:NADH dehydrogenase [ubiquinone] 1 alpha subcomplex assembly factor 2 isoform X2 [Peromyscus californicus insignis]|uniref:NADH dehydrogenase [ubiquinone] 1 alpha subcomplex assembly factor 2 isoform X2 n=1 Tax=Peromyscus californicus insignis TaxID=564181 RepID=UPI0022A6CABA|nr:NADH dehydrogenase [ubiquinone] 1 alpha subcomplex assembly factor 2 isoform X2 [Peromyscus californicus insignis]